MLNAVEAWCWTPAKRECCLEVAVQIELPGGAIVAGGGVVPGVARDHGGGRHGVVLAERSRSAGAFLEVGDKDAVRCADAQEVVHVDVAALGLGAAFRQKRDRVGDSATAGTGPGTGPLAPEPGLECERGDAEAVCRVSHKGAGALIQAPA